MNLFLILFLNLSFSMALANSSIITSLSLDQCMYDTSSESNDRSFFLTCPGHEGYAVLLKVNDVYSWVELEKSAATISTYHLQISQPQGYFPQIGDSLEWRYDNENQLIALIFPVETSILDDAPPIIIKTWFVTCISGSELGMIGLASTLEGARTLADKKENQVCGEWLGM